MSAYEINFSDPLTTSFTIPDGSYNGPGGNSSTTSLRLYGRGALEWGESVNEDLVKLLETFSSATPPSTPVHGQLWIEMQPYYYNSLTHSFYVYNYSSSEWQLLPVIQATTAPTAVQGQYWFNTSSSILYFYHKLFAQQPATWLPRSFITGDVAPDASIRPMQMLRAFDASTHTWTSAPVVEVSNATTAPIGNRVGSLRFSTAQSSLRVWSGSAWVSLTGSSGGGTTYTLPQASAFTLGGIKIGSGLAIALDGTVSVATGQPSYPTATAIAVGGVKIGANVTITSDGTISVAAPPPPATAGLAGVVRVGSGLTVDGSGVLSVTASSYTLPAATISTLGGVKVGEGLVVGADGTIATAATGSSTLVWDRTTGALGPTGGPSMATMSNGWYMVRLADDGTRGFGYLTTTVYKLGTVPHPVYNFIGGSPAYIVHVAYDAYEIAAFHYAVTGSAADAGSNISSLISQVFRIW